MTLPWWEPIFYACNYGVVGAWALLVLFPRWRWTGRLVHAGLVPLLFGLAYALILFTDRDGSPEGSYFNLDGIQALFESRQTVAAAWIHYLIFDLFVGAWIARDAARRTIPHLATVPFLVLTLLFGPIGLLGYLVLRGGWTGRWRLEESDNSG